MPKFRKKPVVIEAVYFTGSGDSCTEVTAFLGGSSVPGHTCQQARARRAA